jgi:hypothetical protein
VSSSEKPAAVIFLFLILALVVLAVESCSESVWRRKEAEKEYNLKENNHEN